MELAFGRDLAPVRLHTGADAAGYAAEQRAAAVTVEGAVYFGAGYRPGSERGNRLLAHELAHTVQQRADGSGELVAVDPERAAERAAVEVTAGRAVGSGLGAMSSSTPAHQTIPWATAVHDAQAEPDEAKRNAALAGLVRRALGSRAVRLAGTSSPSAVAAADYDPTPAINFDPKLNAKTKWNSTKVASDNVGYTFTTTTGGTSASYSILGPKALDAAGGEVHTQMYADHELFHASHPTGPTVSEADKELEAWTDTYVHYFLPTYMNREGWIPLIGYYEGATASAQATALTALAAFANGLATTPGTGGSTRSDRERFETWLRRRLNDEATKAKKLVVDLSAKLGITASAPKAPAPKGSAP